MAYIIFLALASALLFLELVCKADCSHISFLMLIAWLEYSHRIIWFYKVVSTTPWPLGKIIRWSIWMSRIFVFPRSILSSRSKKIRWCLTSCWTDVGCSALQMNLSGSFPIQSEIVLHFCTLVRVYYHSISIHCQKKMLCWIETCMRATTSHQEQWEGAKLWIQTDIRRTRGKARTYRQMDGYTHRK